RIGYWRRRNAVVNRRRGNRDRRDTARRRCRLCGGADEAAPGHARRRSCVAFGKVRGGLVAAHRRWRLRPLPSRVFATDSTERNEAALKAGGSYGGRGGAPRLPPLTTPRGPQLEAGRCLYRRARRPRRDGRGPRVRLA